MKKVVILTTLLCMLSLVHAAPTLAQETTPPNGFRTRMVQDATRMIAADSNAVVLAESSVARLQVSLPPAGSVPLPIEARLTALVEQLPRGTRWMKLLLPAPPEGRSFRADDLADLVVTQEKLFGPKGDSIAIRIQPVAERDAATKSDLKLVYLIINSRNHAAMAFRGGDFAQMNDAQKKQWLQNAAQSFKSMDPTTRLMVLGDMLKVPAALLKEATDGMSPDEVSKFLLDMGGEIKSDGSSSTITVTPNAP